MRLEVSAISGQRSAVSHQLSAISDQRSATSLPLASSLMAHPSWLIPSSLLCVLSASVLSPSPARTREALNRSPSLKILRKKSRLVSCQAAFDGPRYREYLPGARRGSRGSLYRRSCSSVFTSSMSTSQFPGAGARRLWRAQANPYAAKNLVRAAVADHRDPRVTTLG